MWCFEIWPFYPFAVSGSESSFCDLYQIWCSSFGVAARPTQKLRSPSSHTPNTHGEKQKGSTQEQNGRHRTATHSKRQFGSSARWRCRHLSLLAENAPWWAVSSGVAPGLLFVTALGLTDRSQPDRGQTHPKQCAESVCPSASSPSRVTLSSPSAPPRSCFRFLLSKLLWGRGRG